MLLEHFVLASGRINILKFLIDNGADVNLKDGDELTALILAAQSGKLISNSIKIGI